MTNPTTAIQTKLAVKETEDTITHGVRSWSGLFQNRENYNRQTVLEQALTAWRSNPLGKRIVEITTEFVLGDGFSFSCQHDRTNRFLKAWWNDPLNEIDAQLPEWADEAWRTGDLFILFSLDPSGASYVRAIPAEMIGSIETKGNDYRQETKYIVGTAQGGETYPAYTPGEPQDSFVLHFPLNRAIGNTFGESDLTSVLYWIGLYKQWLEDRARFNYFRQLFSFIVKKPFENETKKKDYVNNLTTRTPKPGAVMVIDPNEEWGVLNPQLSSFEAGEDGLAIKRMIAAGVGMPLHYLAEPESSTRTTADAAGTPTFKRFKRRQNYLRMALLRVLMVALEIERRTNSHIPQGVEVEIEVPDITERDNANLSIAVQRIVTAFAPLYNAKLVDSTELIRLVYRFLAETPPEIDPDAPFQPIGNITPTGAQLPPEEPDPVKPAIETPDEEPDA